LRETILLDTVFGTGAMTVGADGIEGGWNPYDPSCDAQFPDHPAPRARRSLVALENYVRLSDWLKAAPRFPLPASEPGWALKEHS
jgi:hypothetical protein